MNESRANAPLRVQITDACAGLRADVALAKLLPGYSRRLFKELGLAGELRSGHRRIRASERVQTGQEIEIRLPTDEGTGPTRDHPRIVRTTPELLYVAKPAGMHTCGRWPQQPGTLAQWILSHHPECAEASPDLREAGAVHRLDRVTSGLVVFARHRQAWTRARSYFDRQQVRKIYLAASLQPGRHESSAPAEYTQRTSENPTLLAFRNDLASRWLAKLPDAHRYHPQSSGPLEITAPLTNADDAGRVHVHFHGRPAHSSVVALAQRADEIGTDLKLFLVQIHSGARHQIRAHLAHIDHPILGDAVYGTVEVDRRAIALHAIHIAFPDALDHVGGVTVDPPRQWLATWLADEAHT